MLDMDRKQAVIFLFMAAIILGLTGFIIFRESNTNYDSDVMLVDNYLYESYESDITKDRTNIEKNEDNENVEENNGKIKVYITGQVRNPGVIEIGQGSRLEDVVNKAGGFLEEADLLRINLAIKVKDEGMYVIPKKGETLSEDVYEVSNNQEDNAKININTANESELEQLPRIGPVLARSIIEYREKNGPFENIEDIMNVSGIGNKTFEGLKDLVTVE